VENYICKTGPEELKAFEFFKYETLIALECILFIISSDYQEYLQNKPARKELYQSVGR
jgi:hypothetical protein